MRVRMRRVRSLAALQRLRVMRERRVAVLRDYALGVLLAWLCGMAVYLILAIAAWNHATH